jgi:hypothetical protein
MQETHTQTKKEICIMRSYKELQKIKVAEMTGEEMTMFNRVNESLKPAKESGFLSTLGKGVRGTFRSIGDNFVEKAEITDLYDKKARRESIKEELSDLEQAKHAGRVAEKKYNLIKAQLEVELDEL